MRGIRFSVALALALAITDLCPASSGAQAAPAPQTARQALMEMFFSKTPGTLVQHLPAATRAALEKAGALTKLQEYSAMASQLQAQGQHFETFETGSVLLSTEDAKTGQKTEMTVVNDALRGDQDDIEMAFHIYKNGKEERMPFMPQMTFSMKQEGQVWTLNEISITIRLPLADPDLLRTITEKMKPQAPTTTTFTAHAMEPSVQTASSDAMVVAAMRTILTAEVTYATSYPTVGFTCSLASLDGFGGGEPNERQAMLINSGLASGRKYGYVFTLSGCGGAPATSFHLTAAPSGNAYGRKAFCADQSGVIRSSADGNAATCLASATVVQ
jgi:type IV pilus assembly protein PilA